VEADPTGKSWWRAAAAAIAVVPLQPPPPPLVGIRRPRPTATIGLMLALVRPNRRTRITHRTH